MRSIVNDQIVDKFCVTLPTACINSTLFSGIARTVKIDLMSPALLVIMSH